MNIIRTRGKRVSLAVSIVILLILLSCIFINSLQSDYANAEIISNADIIESDLLLDKNYRGMKAGESVFNKDAINQLYDKILGIENATYKDIESAANEKKSGYTPNTSTTGESNAVVKSMHSGRDSQDIRDKNNSRNVIVKLDGKEWIVTALTTATNGHVILTLYLKDVSFVSKWSNWVPNSATDYSATYHATMYTTSYIRSALLNGRVEYTTDGSNLTSFTDEEKKEIYGDDGYPFGIYVDDTEQGSITDFLIAPNQVEYQQNENLYDVTYGIQSSIWYAATNESSMNKIAGSKWYYARPVQSNAKYFDWSSDKLWLPSLSETGQGVRSGAYRHGGLWGLDDQQRSSRSDRYSWLRAGSASTSHLAYYLSSGGAHYDLAVNSTNVSGVLLGVRPAIHLDLTVANTSSASSVTVPKDIVKYYNGAAQGVEGESWYTDEVADAMSTVEYYDKSGTTKIAKPTAKGEYKVKFTLKDKFYWADNDTSKSKTVDMKIDKALLEYPSFFDNKNSAVYAGGNEITFTLSTYDTNAIDIKFDGTSIGDTVKASAVGKYTLEVSLKDTDNYGWKPGSPTTLEFEIVKGQIDVSITDSDGGLELSGTQGQKLTAQLEVPANMKLPSGEVVDISVKASTTGLTREICAMQIDSTSRIVDIELDLSSLPFGRTYELSVEATSGNYNVRLTSATRVTVLEAGIIPMLTWSFCKEGIPVRGEYVDVEIGEKEIEYDKSVAYNGKRYSFQVVVPSGYTLDTSYEGNGYLVTSENASNNNIGINADTYTTKVRIINNATNLGEEYSIKWSIDKAKFDLSKVKWKGDGRLEYNGLSQEMVLENLPDKLTASYGRDYSHTDVGSGMVVTVDYLEFVNASDEDNYVLPDIDDPTTYEGNVEWEKEWSIVPKEIKVQWGKELLKDKDGNPFNIAILRSKGENTVVVHTYYKSDGKGNKVGEAISESDIVVPESGTEYYICELTLSSNDGYKLVGTTTREFAVSNQGSAVKFTPNKLTFAYTGEEIKLWFSNDGNLKSSQYKVTYYSAGGASPLTSAPMSVGKYRVEITLNDELNGKYFIGGDSEWEFEIVARIINESWNTTSKPPRLNINKTELGMIDYEFMNEEGNVVSYEQMKSKAGVYSVRAKIKGTYIGNCSFASGNNETEWIDFELTEDDLANMQDPNDPTLYPDDPDMQEPDNNNPSGDVSGDVSTNPEDKGGVDFDKISKILKEWWQVIASGISIVLIIIFMAKTAGYESRRKKANKKIDKYESTVYAATTGLFGLATTAWTAIACVLMGMAVLSFVIMLIAKNRCNKSEDSLEEAKEDYERNKENNRRDYDDNRRDEEYRRRDEEYRQREEDMKAMFMRMMGGYDFNNMGQPQGAYMGAQQGIGAEEIRGIVSETVTALLPGMQQALPQQASVNDELMQKLIEKEEQNDKTITKLIEQNERLMQDNAENQKVMQSLMQQLANKEATATNVNDELVNRLIEQNDKLMQRLAEQQPQQVVTSQPQIIEKIVEKPVEKIVEVPVETVVEKVVEKPIVISTEAVGEAEKSKQVKTPSPKKAPAPRLTLEEAYAKLTKEQKKYFDGLREYAMSKDSKCKEKLSTYFTTIGPSTTNPFIKLTIKKGITVALFKMEDEYLKDIRRNASGDGTKVKVKETEVPIGDKQAYDTAKDMVDLRIDQIDRYNDFLKEQRALRK